MTQQAKFKGYTLLEMVAVLAIMAILVLATLPLSETWLRSQKEKQLRESLWEIRDAIDRYKRMYDLGQIATTGTTGSGFPPDLKTLVDGAPEILPDKRVASHKKHYFLRRIPRDPFSDHDGPNDQTWGLRSYASSADQPAAGQDVYDVFSLSTQKALDGTSYRNW